MRRKIIPITILCILLIILGYITFIDDGVRYDFFVLATNYFIIVFSLLNIFLNKGLSFSLNMIFHLFNLFFIGIAPVLQFKSNTSFFSLQNQLTNADFFYVNSLFIIAIILYTVLYSFFIKRLTRNRVLHMKLAIRQSRFNEKRLLLISVLITLFILIYFRFNFNALLLRSYLWNDKSDYNRSILSIINVFRICPLILFLSYKFYCKKNVLAEVLFLALIIICNFPIAISRYKLAVIYLPIVLVYFKFLYERKHIFSISFIVTFLSFFPYLHHFRYNNNFIPQYLFNFKMFTEKHFDTYQNTVIIIKNEVITYGDQLLGVLLFCVPRVFWESKSNGSGKLLVKEIGFDGFSNVALSYFGEGYINFGIIGVVIFVIILAIINAFSDFVFWYNNKEKYYIVPVYLVLISMEFFILRGSLLASFANLIGYVCVIFLFHYTLKLRFFMKK